MKRTTFPLGIGVGLFAAALLASCGGGSGTSALPAAVVPSPGASSSGNNAAQSGLRLQLVIPRTAKRRLAVERKGAHPMYVSTAALGLQLSVTAQGSNQSQTIYVNIGPSSPLCTRPASLSGSEETCTIPIPVVGTTETVTATEVDQTPTGVSASTGLGTGFGSNGYVLAVGSATLNTTGFNNSVPLALGQVVAQFFDCELSGNAPPEPNPQSFADDRDNARIVVTAGAPTSGTISLAFMDAACGWYDALPPPAPGFTPVPPAFVDANGSPEPITYAASTNAISLGLWPSVGSTPSSYAQSGTIASSTNEIFDTLYAFNVNVGAMPTPNALPVGNPTPAATIAFANNLSATPPSPFRGTNGASSYAASLTYVISPIWAYPSTVTVSASATATVTGFDYGAIAGMNAESSFSVQNNACLDTSNGNEDASVSGLGMQGNWQEQFSIAPYSTGTCTFVLYDSDTGVITLPVTVTITP